MFSFKTWLLENDLPDMTNRFRVGAQLGAGTTSKVHSIEGDDDRVVGFIDSDDALKRIQDRQRAIAGLPPGITPQIQDIGRHGDKFAYTMDKAHGDPAHRDMGSPKDWSGRLAQLAAAPQDQYDALMGHTNTLKQHKFSTDNSTSNNLLYHPEKGFKHLDLGAGSTGDSIDLLSPILRLDKYAQHATEEDLRNALTIVAKLLHSGYSHKEILQSQKNVVAALEQRDPHLGRMYISGLEKLGLPKNAGREEMKRLQIGSFEASQNVVTPFGLFVAKRAKLPDPEKYKETPFSIRFDNGTFVVEPDKPGVYVNGQQATHTTPVLDGATIRYADAEPFKVRYSTSYF